LSDVQHKETALAATEIVLTQVATWATYGVATWFLYFLLPGYPKSDWLCSGACTVAALKPIVGPFMIVALGQLLLFDGLRTLLGRAAASQVLGLSLMSPGIVAGLVSIDWAIVCLLSGVLVQAKAQRNQWAEVAVAGICGLAAPAPVSFGLLVAIACWRAPTVRIAGLATVVGLAALAARLAVSGWHDPIPLPTREVGGVLIVGWLVIVPMVAASAWALLAPERRGLGLAALGTTFISLALVGAPPLRFVGAMPLAWVLWAGVPRSVHAGLSVSLGAAQGVVLYHLAHQVPVL
jgi:hypothetical protein